MTTPSAHAGPDGYEDLPEHLDRRLMQIAAVVILGSFMSILDTTIVNVAINDLADEFDATLTTIQWVATGYLLALSTVIPLSGWFADRFGTKRLYMTSIFLFVLGSLLSGLAWSAESLILFRVLQGFGGGMIMPIGMTILTQSAGPKRMGRMMGLIGVPMLLGPVLGPILGGYFVDMVSWRWIFFVNLPIGAVALVMAGRLLSRDEPGTVPRLDWLGLLLLSPGLAIFVFGLAETSSEGGFGSLKTVGPVVVGAALVVAFVLHALRLRERALIDVRLFRKFPVGPAAATTFLFGTAFFGTMFLVPLWFQLVRGESAFHAGLLIAPQGIGAMITMPIAGRFTDRTGAGRIVLIGLPLSAAALLGLTFVGATTPLGLVVALLFLNGLGMGATMMPAMSAALRSLKRAEVARATSGINVLQRTGGSIGIAVLAVVLAHALSTNLPGMESGGADGSLAAAQQASPEVQGQIAEALGTAFHQPFAWALAFTLLALIPASRLPRSLPAAQGTSPAAAPAAMAAME